MRSKCYLFVHFYYCRVKSHQVDNFPYILLKCLQILILSRDMLYFCIFESHFLKKLKVLKLFAFIRQDWIYQLNFDVLEIGLFHIHRTFGDVWIGDFNSRKRIGQIYHGSDLPDSWWDIASKAFFFILFLDFYHVDFSVKITV